ncbi:MAG TPA: hypothetical protein VFH08_05680 [Chitinophagaceae bacterium]|nr:hypothetical protein [Chitinophagaceae bacterium]
MKSITMPVREQLDEKTKDQLFNEVNETVVKTLPIAIGMKNQKKKTFTVQDMWNRQRQAKSASAMMRRWNLN